MADIKLPALNPQDVLPRGEKLCKYYILEGIYYLHILQDPKQTDDLVNRIIELSQQLNVTFQGRNVEALGALMGETLRKLILVLKTTNETNEINKAIKILYNRPINLKPHQIDSLLGKGAQEMWNTIKSRGNKTNPIDLLYSQNINNCQITIKEKKKNKDISIAEYLSDVLAPNIENIITKSGDIIRTVNSVDIENITLDNIYEVYMLCADPTGGKPTPMAMKVSEHLTRIMSGFFNIVSVVGFRLLAKLSYTSGVKRVVKMERIKYETGKFLFRDSETYQKYKQDVREANRQLLGSITGLAGGIVSPFYSAIKSHPLGRLLVSMGEFGFKQTYLRTGRFFGAGYKKSGYRDYYESRIPSAFDSEEAWSSFSSKTQTDHRLDYEKGQAFMQLQNLLRKATNNPKYDDESNINKLLNQPRLNDAVINYNNLLLKGVDKLNDKERDALERYKEVISNYTGLKDEGHIRKFVELYLRYLSYQGIAGMRNTRNASNTAYFGLPSSSSAGATSYATGQPSVVSGSALPNMPSITQPGVPAEPPEQSSTPSNANVQQSSQIPSRATSWRRLAEQQSQTQSSGASGNQPQQEAQATTETPTPEIQDLANKLANAITRSLPQDLSAAIPLIASAVTQVVQSNIAKTQERREAGVQQYDLSTTQKEVKTELLDKICDVIKCVNKDINRGTTSPEELSQLLNAIAKQEKEISKMAELVVDTVKDKSQSQKSAGAGSGSGGATGGVTSGSRSGVKQQSTGQSLHKQQTPQVSHPATPASISPTTPSVQNISNATSSPSQPAPSSTKKQKQKSPGKTQVSKQSTSAPSPSGGTSAKTKRRNAKKKVKKSNIRSAMRGYLNQKAKSMIGKRAGAAVATEGLAGLAGSQGMGGALRTIMGGGRMLGMLANPLGIALGVGLLGLAGYGGYKILTKAILPQIQGKGFSFVEDKRRETIDSIIAKMGEPTDEAKKKLDAVRSNLGKGVSIRVVGGGSGNTAAMIRTQNTEAIKISGRGASSGAVGVENVSVGTVSSVPQIQPITPPQPPSQQVSPEQREGTEQKKKEVADIVSSSQYQGEAQQQGQAYNQAMINAAIQSGNAQLVNLLQKYNDALLTLTSQIGQIQATLNSNPSAIKPS